MKNISSFVNASVKVIAAVVLFVLFAVVVHFGVIMTVRNLCASPVSPSTPVVTEEKIGEGSESVVDYYRVHIDGYTYILAKKTFGNAQSISLVKQN